MIKVENLKKTFGTKRAVNGISFTVERGEVLGFLGPNGAGKSTSMRMITGFIPPTDGRITVGGHDILDEPTDGLDPNQKHEVRQLIRRMGEKKAIIFSTHILEEVEAVCSRAIIIDRGQIVANGTPQELKQRSEVAGAVSLRVLGVAGDTVKQRLSAVTGASKAAIVK